MKFTLWLYDIRTILHKCHTRSIVSWSTCTSSLLLRHCWSIGKTAIVAISRQCLVKWTHLNIYILIDMCIYKSVHKCHINLIVSPGTYPFSNEYSERYLPYFCHPRDVTCERWLVYHKSSSTCNNPGKRCLCELLYYYMPIFYNIRARGISHRHAATTLQAIDICRAGARRPVTFWRRTDTTICLLNSFLLFSWWPK